MSGCEFEVRELILSQISDCCDSTCVDKIGNLIAVKKSKEIVQIESPKVDESIKQHSVTRNSEKGFIRSKYELL